MMKFGKLFIFVAFLLHFSIADRRDPYEVIGIRRNASPSEIKKAYKRLAKEWHPDKNQKAEANDRFVEINEAYELLSDPMQKDRFDRFGAFDSVQNDQPNRHNPFEDIFDAFNNFGKQASSSYFNQHRITLRMYHNTLLEKSQKQPFIIFAYSDWCMACHQVEPIWEQIVEHLDPIGYGIGTVNNMLEGTLIERLRVHKLPSVVFLIEGRVFHYRGKFNLRDVVKYGRSVIPSHFVQPIATHDGLRRFLDMWSSTNKPAVLMIGNQDKPRLRFVLAAMKYSQYCRFGYLQLSVMTDQQALKEALDLRSNVGETMLIFNELPEEGPVARLTSVQDISTTSMRDLIENNKHLTLPRISSQEHFDDLCPVSTNWKRFCCILIVEKGSKDDLVHLDAMRQFVDSDIMSMSHINSEKIKFVYIYSDSQKEFLNPLETVYLDDSVGNQNAKDVLLVWRTGSKQAKYEWLPKIWNGIDENYNKSAHKLIKKMDLYIRGKELLTKEAALNELVDEYGPGWFSRLSSRTMRIWETFLFHVSKDEFLPAISALGTLVLILLIGYGLNYVAAAEASKERKEQERINKEKRNTLLKHGAKSTDLLRELRAETYFGMVRLLKPGCRTLVVIVDEASRDVLLQQFVKCIWPWRNNKTLTFGYVMVEKNLGWFRTILQHTMPGPTEDEPVEPGSMAATLQKRLQHINPKQVIGTVFALNGWRLYFCMYHPKHAPSMVGFKPKGPKNSAKNFMGFDDDVSSSDSDTGAASREEMEAFQKKRKLKVEELLVGLPNWLDRLFEGSIRRYYVPEWPPIK